LAPPFGDCCRNTLCDLGPSGSPYSARHRRDRCMILPFRSSVHRRGDHFTLRLPARGNMAPKRTYRHILYPFLFLFRLTEWLLLLGTKNTSRETGKPICHVCHYLVVAPPGSQRRWLLLRTHSLPPSLALKQVALPSLCFRSGSCCLVKKFHQGSSLSMSLFLTVTRTNDLCLQDSLP
jgi:hypothetical protein